MRKTRICGGAFIASSEGIPHATAWASNFALLQKLPTLHQEHPPRQLWLSPHWSTTSGWWLAQHLDPVIGSFSEDAQLTTPVIDQCSSPALNILRMCREWCDSMVSARLYPDLEAFGLLRSSRLKKQEWSYSKKWCICREHWTWCHGLRSSTRTSKSNNSITTVSKCSIAKGGWFPPHLRSISNWF